MERRKNKRVSFFATALFSKTSEPRMNYGVIKDVSSSGIFLVTNVSLDLGEKIWVDFRVSGAEIKLNGTIVRKKRIDNPSLAKFGKGGMGVEVEPMHPLILEYIKERTETPS